MNENVPAHLPEIADARLPATYESARKALAECSEIDECKSWSDKAAALASYARQAKDSTLHNLALRIQARAMRRCGELVGQTPAAQGANQNIQEGDLPKVTRESVATAAGLSEHQRKTGLRIASIPEADFEAAVESDTPPTVSALAMRGTAQRPQPELPQVSPADPATAARAQALLRDFAAFCAIADPLRVACAAVDADLARGYVSTIDRWLDRFVTNLGAEDAAA